MHGGLQSTRSIRSHTPFHLASRPSLLLYFQVMIVWKMEGHAKDHFLKSEDYDVRSPEVSSSWKSLIRAPLDLGMLRTVSTQLHIISDLMTVFLINFWMRCLNPVLNLHFLLTFPLGFQEVGR